MAINLTDKEYLNKYLEYEVTGLCNTRKFIVWSYLNEDFISKRVAPFQVFKNIGINSLAVHARNLYEFYFELNPKANRANRYIKNFKKPSYTKHITTEFKKDVNMQVMHMGWGRDMSKEWQIGLVNDFLKITIDFLEKLNPEYYAESLTKLKPFIESEYGKTKFNLVQVKLND